MSQYSVILIDIFLIYIILSSQAVYTTTQVLGDDASSMLGN